MSEWVQFTGSIKKNENDRRARIIMRKSDLSVWDKHTSVIGDDSMYPTYDIGY